MYEQANIFATARQTSSQAAQRVFSIQPTATKLKVSGVALFSAGDIDVVTTAEQLIYIKILAIASIKNHRKRQPYFITAVLYGDVQEGDLVFELIQNQHDISAIKDKLLFGKAFL